MRHEPLIQTEIEERILELTRQLEDETDSYETLCDRKVTTEVEYKRQYWQEYLAASGSIKERESLAGYKTADQYREFRAAEALTAAKKEKLNTLRSAMSALQTISANVRAQT